MSIRIDNFRAYETVKGATVTTSSQTVTFTSRGTKVEATDCLVTNNSDKIIFVEPGEVATEVGDGVTPVNPGAQFVVPKGKKQSKMSYIGGAAATGSVYFTAGIGS